MQSTDWEEQLFAVLDKQPLLKIWRERAMQSLVLEDAPKVQEHYERFRAWCKDPTQLLTEKYEEDFLWEKLLGVLCEQETGAAKEEDLEMRVSLRKKWREAFDSLRFGKKKIERVESFINANMGEETAKRLLSVICLVPGTEKLFAFHHWLESGDISCRIPHEDFYALLSIYYKLKAERNQSNHAREDSKPGGAETLRALFEEALPLLEKL